MYNEIIQRDVELLHIYIFGGSSHYEQSGLHNLKGFLSIVTGTDVMS
jgi:hypothetical protein